MKKRQLSKMTGFDHISPELQKLVRPVDQMSMMTIERVRDILREGVPFESGISVDMLADAIDAHLRREVKVPEDAYGESVEQIITKALCELSNAREDVESGKPATAILSFLREAEAYMEAAREAMLAAAPTHSGATDGQQESKS